MAPVTRAQGRANQQPAGLDSTDPADLGPYLLGHILSYLPPSDLLAAAAVSRAWREAAGRQELWQAHCEAAWQDRVYVAPAARQDLPWKQRYLAAQADQRRTAITEQELATFVWRFRFKEQAGEFWCSLDPFHWTGGQSWFRRAFLADGRTLPAGSLALWEPLFAAIGVHQFCWKLTKSQQGRKGTFVKIHTFPSMTPTRLPDGGWRLENEWVIYEAVLPRQGPYCRGIQPGMQRYLAEHRKQEAGLEDLPPELRLSYSGT